MGAVIVVALLGVPTLYLVRSIVRQQRVRWPRLTMWVPILYIVSALLPAAFVSWFYSFPFEDLDLADRPERSWRNNPNDPVVVAWIYLLPGWLWLLNVLRMCFRPSKPRQMTAAIVVALVLLWVPIQLIAPYIDAPVAAQIGYLLLTAALGFSVARSYQRDKDQLTSDRLSVQP